MKTKAFTTLATLVLSTTGCAVSNNSSSRLLTETTYQRPSIQHTTPENIKNSELKRVTHKDSLYNLEEVVLHEKRMYAQENISPQENELNIAFVLYDDHRRRINDQTQETTITSDSLYIPTQALNPKNKKATRINLSTSGKYGVKSEMTDFNISNIQSGIIKTTQDDARIHLRTIQISGQEWYIPKVKEDLLSDPNALPFYLIPVEGTIKEINAKGRITLDSPAGIFRPVKVSRQDYNSRAKIEKPIPSKDNPGQSLGIF